MRYCLLTPSHYRQMQPFEGPQQAFSCGTWRAPLRIAFIQAPQSLSRASQAPAHLVFQQGEGSQGQAADPQQPFAMVVPVHIHGGDAYRTSLHALEVPFHAELTMIGPQHRGRIQAVSLGTPIGQIDPPSQQPLPGCNGLLLAHHLPVLLPLKACRTPIVLL